MGNTPMRWAGILCILAGSLPQTSWARASYSTCIQKYQQNQYQQTLVCICKYRQSQPPRNIHLYHMAQAHMRIAKGAALHSTQRTLHQELALRRYREYAAKERLSIVRREIAMKKVQQLQQELAFASVQFSISPKHRKHLQLHLQGTYLRCSATLQHPPQPPTTFVCHIQPPTPKPLPPTIQRCIYPPFRRALKPQKGLLLAPGPYALTARRPGYHSPSHLLMLVHRQTRKLQITLQRQLASIWLRTEPSGATLLLRKPDGSSLRASSPHHFSQLSPGTYRLLVSRKGYPSKRAQIALTAGRQSNAFFALGPGLTPPASRAPFLASGITAVVSLLVLAGGISTGILAHNESATTATIAYQSTNWNTRFHNANSLSIASGVLYIASGVSGVAAIGLLISALVQQKRQHRPGNALTPTIQIK